MAEWVGRGELFMGFPHGAVLKHPPTNAGDARDVGLIPGSGRSPEMGNGNPLRYSCLENPMERSLAGYSPQGGRELDMTAHIHIPRFRYLTTSGSFLPVLGNFTT